MVGTGGGVVAATTGPDKCGEPDEEGHALHGLRLPQEQAIHVIQYGAKGDGSQLLEDEARPGRVPPHGARFLVRHAIVQSTQLALANAVHDAADQHPGDAAQEEWVADPQHRLAGPRTLDLAALRFAQRPR